jgi:hypothetical protein
MKTEVDLNPKDCVDLNSAVEFPLWPKRSTTEVPQKTLKLCINVHP